MNWELASAVADLAGAAAVVMSLVYLARQVRMSNRLARAEAYRSPNSDLNSLNATFSTDPIFRAAFRRAIEGASELKSSPRLRRSRGLPFASISSARLRRILAVPCGPCSAPRRSRNARPAFCSS